MNQPEAGADVEQLLELSGSGPFVLADLLEGCLRHLRQVEEARYALAQLPPEKVREAIARRQQRLGDVRGGS